MQVEVIVYEHGFATGFQNAAHFLHGRQRIRQVLQNEARDREIETAIGEIHLRDGLLDDRVLVGPIGGERLLAFAHQEIVDLHTDVAAREVEKQLLEDMPRSAAALQYPHPVAQAEPPQAPEFLVPEELDLRLQTFDFVIDVGREVLDPI